MRKSIVVISAWLVLEAASAFAAQPPECAAYDKKITGQYAGAIQAAMNSGSACQKTKTQVALMNAYLKAPKTCFKPGEKEKVRAALKQSMRSLRDQGCQ